MDKNVVDKLGADNLACIMVITCLCRNLAAVSADLALCVRKALDEASRKAEDVAIQLGERVRPEYTIEALRVVEEIRAGVLGSQGEPDGG